MAYNHREVLARKKREDWERHTEMMLRDNWDSYSKSVNKTEEKLLEVHRTGKAPNTVTEEQLDEVRDVTREAVTEKRIDTTKPEFGGKFRDDPLDGSEVPPLEKKRLATKPAMEDEKLEPANEE